MQLELLYWEPELPEFKYTDCNRGRYDRHKDYFWEYAVSGAGIDLFKWGTMITIFFITEDDIKLFPYLAEFAALAIWEDEEEGVKMLHFKPDAECFLCKDKISSHVRDSHGSHLCEGLL